MKRLGLVVVLALALVAVFARRGEPAPEAARPDSIAAPTSAATSTGGPAAPAPTPSDRLVVRGVAVRDLDGRVAWRGDVDLGPTLARIEAGERDPHRSDGEVFGNRERRLPPRARGWYREYVVRTPGLRGPGPQRLVLGRDGGAFYTADHYATFLEVRSGHDP